LNTPDANISNSDNNDYYYSIMEISHLRILQDLVADPHLSRAAARLHLTQSALSKRVQAMEAEVGHPLFERRGPRGLRPLEAARELSQVAERVTSTWESGLRRLQRAADEPRHFVLVGPPLFLREVFLPWWSTAAKDFPELTVEVRLSSLERASLETIQAGADAGILEHKDELADFICRPIYTERWGIVRHPRGSRELTACQWGTYSAQDNPVDQWLVRRQKMAPPVYRFYWQDLTAIALWVSETPGAASVLPWHSVAWLAKRGKVDFEPLGPDSTKRLYLAYPRANPHRRLIRALTEGIR
jgi:DNA-binding transcriptional LysR family regulator